MLFVALAKEGNERQMLKKPVANVSTEVNSQVFTLVAHFEKAI